VFKFNDVKILKQIETYRLGKIFCANRFKKSKKVSVKNQRPVISISFHERVEKELILKKKLCKNWHHYL